MQKRTTRSSSHHRTYRDASRSVRVLRGLIVVCVLSIIGGIGAYYLSCRFSVYLGIRHAESVAFWSAEPVLVLFTGAAHAAISMLYLFGAVGLFLRWRPARHFFSAGIALFLVVTIIHPPWEAVVRWEGFFALVHYISFGAILMICYSRLGKNIFRKPWFRRDRWLVIMGLGLVIMAAAGGGIFTSLKLNTSVAFQRSLWENRDKPFVSARQDVRVILEEYKEKHGIFPVSLDSLEMTSFPSGVDISYLNCFIYDQLGPTGDDYSLTALIGGIGVALGGEDGRTILSVDPKGGAAHADISFSDRIVEINGKDARETSLEEIFSYLLGPPGTSVTLKLEKGSSSETETVTVMRKPVRMLR